MHAVHVVGGLLPVHAQLGLTDQLVHLLSSAEILGNELKVAGIPRKFGLAVAHHGAPAHLRLVVSRLVRCPARVGVVLDLAVVVVVRLDRVARHVVGVKEAFLVRLNHHLLDFLAGCALLNALARTPLRCLDEPHAHLVAQQGAHRFFPTNLNGAALGHVAGVLKALHLSASQSKDLLVVRNKPAPSLERLFVASQQHPTILVQTALGIGYLPQPKLVLNCSKSGRIMDQPAAIHGLPLHRGPPLKLAGHVHACAVAVHPRLVIVFLQTQPETDLPQLLPVHGVQHGLALLQTGHFAQQLRVLVRPQVLAELDVVLVVEVIRQLVKRPLVNLHAPHLAPAGGVRVLPQDADEPLPGSHARHHLLRAVFGPAHLVDSQPRPDQAQVFCHRRVGSILWLQPRHGHAVLLANRLQQPTDFLLHDPAQVTTGLFHVGDGYLCQRRTPAPHAFRHAACQAEGSEKRKLGSGVCACPGRSAEETPTSREIALGRNASAHGEHAQPHQRVGENVNRRIGNCVPTVLPLHRVRKRLSLARAQRSRIKQNASHRVGGRDSVCNLVDDYTRLVIAAYRVKHPTPP